MKTDSPCYESPRVIIGLFRGNNGSARVNSACTLSKHNAIERGTFESKTKVGIFKELLRFEDKSIKIEKAKYDANTKRRCNEIVVLKGKIRPFKTNRIKRLWKL